MIRQTCPAALSGLMAAGSMDGASSPCITVASATSAGQSGITHLSLACVMAPVLPDMMLPAWPPLVPLAS